MGQRASTALVRRMVTPSRSNASGRADSLIGARSFAVMDVGLGRTRPPTKSTSGALNLDTPCDAPKARAQHDRRAPVPPLYAIPTGAAKAPGLRTFYALAATISELSRGFSEKPASSRTN